VFRPPQRTKLLAALIGSGIQILCVAFVVIGEISGWIISGLWQCACFLIFKNVLLAL